MHKYLDLWILFVTFMTVFKKIKIMFTNKKFNSLIEFVKMFPDEQTCINYLESTIWNSNVISPFDPTSKVYKCKGNQYRCKNTGKYFNIKTNTIFENTKIGLPKWFVAIWLVLSHKKGISSIHLSKEIEVTQKTAWFMLQRIRNCFGTPESEPLLTGEIEMDETFVGGKNRNRHSNKKVHNSQGRSFKDKTPVLGMVERGGKLRAFVILSTSREHITPIVMQNVDINAIIYTDEWQGYDIVGQYYHREFIDHSSKQYVNGNVTTNRIEGFWGIFKRGIIGIYNKVSKQHLQKYVDEFVWRYNARGLNNGLQFNLFLCNINHRLTYAQLVSNNVKNRKL